MKPDPVIIFAAAEDDTDSVDGLVVRQWQRYGHDRSYVRTVGGAALGHRDNRTGAVTVDDEAFRAVVEQALAENALPLVAPLVVGTVAAVPLADLTPDPWNDLAGTQPGAAARARADALRRQAPVRTLLSRALGLRTDERAWRIGADGEEAVARQLRGLGPRWRFLHAVPVGDRGADIDHVVVGPAGVFTVNAKHHPDASVWVGDGCVVVDGRPRPYVRNSRHEALRARRLLSAALGTPAPPVTGLVALVGARGGFAVAEQPRDGAVLVLARRDLADWLGRQPERLTDVQVDRLHAVARRADTWTT